MNIRERIEKIRNRIGIRANKDVKKAKCPRCGKRLCWDWCQDDVGYQGEKPNYLKKERIDIGEKDFINYWRCECGTIVAFGWGNPDYGYSVFWHPELADINWEVKENACSWCA